MSGASKSRSRRGVDRPPQFVMVAFDNCTELDRWDDWSKFFKLVKNKVRVTFFVSGTNFLAESNKQKYTGPGHQPGESLIDFGGSVADVKKRIAFINALYRKGKGGHEFGSHAVGHFHANDDHWSDADWIGEFRSYGGLLDEIAANNGLASGFDFSSSDVRGFRAPFLEAGDALDAALKQFQYRFDTSIDGDADAWPVKDANGVWRFKLASIPVKGYPKKTLSMDYNFLVLQSGGKDDPDHSHWPRYRKEMLDAYMAYFKSNYEGNRAPIHIGHHFAEYQGGTYRLALQAFLKQICTLPEVRCVTYSELRDFLEPLSPETLASYQRGDFPHASLGKFAASKPFADLGPIVAVRVTGSANTLQLRASLVGSDRSRFPGGHFEWRYHGRVVAEDPVFDVSSLPGNSAISIELRFRDKSDVVRWRDTLSLVMRNSGAEIRAEVTCCRGMKLPGFRRRVGPAPALRD